MTKYKNVLERYEARKIKNKEYSKTFKIKHPEYNFGYEKRKLLKIKRKEEMHKIITEILNSK